MARLRFVAAGHHDHVCHAFGRKFPHGQWVDAAGMDPEHVETLASNPTFDAELELEPEPAAELEPGPAADVARASRATRRRPGSEASAAGTSTAGAGEP